MFFHYFGKNDVITQIYKESQDNPVPGCIFFEESSPSDESYPILNGLDSLSPLTDILNDCSPVVKNPSPELITDDIYVGFGLNVHCAVSADSLPMGASGTISLSQSTAQLICEENDDNAFTSPSNLLSSSLDMELKVIFHEIGDLVDGNSKLQEMALVHFKNVYKQLLKQISVVSTNSGQAMVSSNPAIEHLKVRKRKKGASG